MKRDVLTIAISSVGLGLLFVSVTLHAQPEKSCRVVNVMPAFWNVVRETSASGLDEQVMRFRSEVVVPNGDLYGLNGFGFASDSDLDKAIPIAIAHARSHTEAAQSIAVQIRSQLPALVADFKRTFPDFQCNFPIYLAPSLGTLDGAGRIINGKPALVIGVDQASEEYSARTLPIFLTHELFHRYHQQVAGFSDDEGDRAPIWRALWAEGLATYVSMKLNPGATLQDALILPKDLVAQASPRRAELAALIAPHLDQSNHAIFAEFFEYHLQKSAIPPRVGYYLGAVIAQHLNRDFTLFDLAHLQPSAVKKLEKHVLEEIASSAGPDRSSYK